MKKDKLLIFACVFATIGIFCFCQGSFALAEETSVDPVYQPIESIVPFQVSVPPQVSSPASIELVSFEPWRTEAFAFAAGTSADAIEDFFRNINMGLTAYDEAGTDYNLNTEFWDLSDINPNSKGIYYAVTTPILEGYTLAEGLTIPKVSIPVSIQEPGKPEINLYYSGRGYMLFPWVITEDQIDSIFLYLYEDGNWRLLSEEDGMCITDSILYLRASLFTLGKDYKLQAEYPGGKTKILSFTYDSTLNIKDYSTGDRDGGDGNSSKLEDQIQNAPSRGTNKSHYKSSSLQVPIQESDENLIQSSDEKPNQEFGKKSDQVSSSVLPALSDIKENKTDISLASVSDISGDSESTISTPAADMTDVVNTKNSPKEFFGKSQDVISGTRLCMMFKNGGGHAQFSKHGILVSLQESNFMSLGLKDIDTFSITINKDSKSEFSICAELNGNPVTELSGTKIMVPYKRAQNDSAIYLTDEYDNRICDGVYDSKLCIVSFTVNHTGSFKITEPASAKSSESVSEAGISAFSSSSNGDNKPSVVPLVACTSLGLAAAGTSSAFFLKRRKFK